MEYIERETAIRALAQYGTGFQFQEAKCVVQGCIQELQAVREEDVVPVRRGQWDVSDTELGWCCKCSVCSSNAVMQYRFCPYCGADMRGE